MLVVWVAHAVEAAWQYRAVGLSLLYRGRRAGRGLLCVTSPQALPDHHRRGTLSLAAQCVSPNKQPGVFAHAYSPDKVACCSSLQPSLLWL